MPEPDTDSGSPHYLPNTTHALPPDATVSMSKLHPPPDAGVLTSRIG
jgi:hypothetical protein